MWTFNNVILAEREPGPGGGPGGGGDKGGLHRVLQAAGGLQDHQHGGVRQHQLLETGINNARAEKRLEILLFKSQKLALNNDQLLISF